MPAVHPSADWLAAYGQGRLSDADSTTVERHLADCPDCRSAVEEAPDDPVVRLVRDTLPRYQPATAASTRAGYCDLRFHARGGLGEVSLARDEAVGREVAIKRLRAESAADPARRKRFLREAVVTARLEHPGIVPVYGVGEDEHGQPCYAMRFVPGKTLLDAVRELHAAGPVTAAGLRPLLGRFVALCETVAYAHSRGVVHRDIKPANVAVGPFGETILLDWGLAAELRGAESVDPVVTSSDSDLRPPASDLTHTGTVLGTPGYMAPEQARGEAVGPAADVYSLGVTLRVIVTGRGPSEPPVAGPNALLAVADRAAAAAPAARYPGPKELAADVERWLADEPVTAYPDPLAVRARRFVRQHQASSAAAVALLAVSTVALSVGAFLLEREQRKTSAALTDRTNALTAEAAQRAVAEAKEAETAAVLGFVDRRVFAAGRPKGRDGGLGKDVRLVDAIAAAEPFVKASFADQPLTEARLRMTLGTSLQHLGNAKAAEQQFTAARHLYESHHGPDHPDALAAAHNLATSLAALGRVKEAAALREQTLARREARLGPDHPDTLATQHSLANSYDDLGRYPEALALRERTLARRRATLGPDHPDTLQSLNGLANSYETLGRHADAARVCEVALAGQTARLGPDHVDTLRSMSNLANNYDDLSRHEEALALRQQVYARRLATLGPDHSDTLRSLHNLGDSYYGLGKYEEAVRHHTDVLARRQALYGSDHPDALQTLNNLAAGHAALGRHDEALRLHTRALELKTAKHGPDHPDTLVTKSNLAATYADLTRHEEALALRRQVLAARTRRLGPDHPSTLSSMRWVADSLVRLGRGEEAVPILDDCLRLSAARPPDPRLLTGVLTLRLRCFADRKDAAGCRATAELWDGLNRTDAGSLVTAAGMWAAAGDADRAMDRLTKAAAAGYKDAAKLEADADLAPLRDRADFRALVAGLRSPAGR